LPLYEISETTLRSAAARSSRAGDARCVAVQAGVRAIADAFRKALCRNGILREHYSSAPHPLFFKAIQI
jgi:hypothetical protein